ncbi:MAG: class I SAM-dependent methyltransferase [Acidobacteriia bacterium]|nr:class I SAM-dependent methyltransferase [Terriglobia bacterium]
MVAVVNTKGYYDLLSARDTPYHENGGMHEILRNLRSDARVLDLGCGSGSFAPESCPGAQVVRLDQSLTKPEHLDGLVCADAAWLPFRDGAFDAVISNHSLEHVDDLARVLQEIGRVVRRDGSLYAAVPDASTLTDHLYRWLLHGGGHINAFRSATELSAEIARVTGLELVATRVLHSSLRFLLYSNYKPRPPRRLWLVGNGNPTVTAWLTYGLRILDRLLGTRASVYGWAFYFGDVRELVGTEAWTNVCIHCGTGYSEASLLEEKRVRRQFLVMRSYLCPICGAWNLFTKDHPAKVGGQDGAAAATG